VALIDPALAGETLHVTPGVSALATAAENCCDPETLPGFGLKVTLTLVPAVTCMLVVALQVELWQLSAFKTMNPEEAIVEGAR